jgi:hypothetical protein
MKRFWFTPQNILAHTEAVWGRKDRMDGLIEKCGSEPVLCGSKAVQ